MSLELVTNQLGAKGSAEAVRAAGDVLGIQDAAHALGPITGLLGDLRLGEGADHVERPVLEPIVLVRCSSSGGGGVCAIRRAVGGGRSENVVNAGSFQLGGVRGRRLAKL